MYETTEQFVNEADPAFANVSDGFEAPLRPTEKEFVTAFDDPP